jgi:hypothetical protein
LLVTLYTVTVLFVALVLLIHGMVQFGLGRLLRLSPEVLAIASSANVGGTLTVMPIATGLRRMDLLLPGILVGSLGNAIGTYAGFLMVGLLQSVSSPISAAQAIPPPPVQSVADCERPTYASDQLVCADAELLALDRELRDGLADEPPGRLIYVSCGLESFLSDTARLTAGGGLRLASLAAFNLMPFTEHVETLAWFERA